MPLLCIPGDSFGYGVCTVLFRRSYDLKQLLFGYALRGMARLYFKRSFGQRARLVEDHRIDSGNGI